MRKVGLGIALLLISSVLIFAPGPLGIGGPIAIITLGTLGLAAGALLVGTSASERPV